MHNETAVRSLFEGVNGRDLAVLDRFFAREYVNHNAFPGQTQGPTGAHIAVRELLAAFPDLRFSVDAAIALSDEVAVRLTIKGTQKNDYPGLLASGRRFTNWGARVVPHVRRPSGRGLDAMGHARTPRSDRSQRLTGPDHGVAEVASRRVEPGRARPNRTNDSGSTAGQTRPLAGAAVTPSIDLG